MELGRRQQLLQIVVQDLGQSLSLAVFRLGQFERQPLKLPGPLLELGERFLTLGFDQDPVGHLLVELVHRRPELLRLCLDLLLELLVPPPQLGLHLLSQGDVLDRPDHLLRTPLGIESDVGVLQDNPLGAVRPDNPVLDLVGLLMGQGVGDSIGDPLSVLRMHVLEE